MGYLKDMLERAIRDTNRLDENTTDATHLYRDYQRKFREKIGHPLIWKTTNNPNLKNPQLVVVVEAYQYFVLVSKRVFNVDAQEATLYYAINYSSLFAGHDMIDFLESIAI